MRRLLLVLALTETLLVAGCGGGSSKSSPSTSGGGGNGGVNLQSIAISPSSATIAAGTTQAFTAMGKYSDGSTKDLTATAQWACLLPNLASVSSTTPTQGMATAIAPGTALVTAASGGVTNSAELTITNATATSLAITPATATIGLGNQQQFKATATFSDMSTQDVTNLATWSYTSPTFGPATFIASSSGLVIGESLGTNDVNASYGTATATTPSTLTVDLSNLVSVAVIPASPTIAKHTQLTFSAIGTFSDGSTRDVSSIASWSSSDTTVANFPGSGGGTATSTGTAGSSTITASVGTFNPTTTLTVSNATLSSITLVPALVTIAPDTKTTLTAVGTFSDGSSQALTTQTTWTSDNPAFASVTQSGIVSGSASNAGGPSNAIANISAVGPNGLGAVQSSVSVVTVSTGTLVSIAVSPATPFITPGNVVAFSAVGTFSDGSTQDVTASSGWTSADKGSCNAAGACVATNTQNVAVAMGTGQTDITATLTQAPGKPITGTGVLAVALPSQISIAITPATVQIASGTATQLKATGTFIDGTTEDMTALVDWSSSAPPVATVGYQTGIVSGLSAGSSTLTAALGSVTSTAQITVTGATLSSISVSPANQSIALGTTQQMIATGTFSDSSTQSLLGATWSSSNPAVAAVNGSGLATSTGVGTATITAVYNGVTAGTNVTVH